MRNGKIVAVKKLAIGQTQRGKAEFESEVKLISNVHHRNLVRLLGCCNKGPELLLVYEYMANSSLDRFLFGNLINSTTTVPLKLQISIYEHNYFIYVVTYL